MFSAVLTALVAVSPATPACCWMRGGPAGGCGCASPPGCCGYEMAVAAPMPAPCGCPSCGCSAGPPVGFGGMPMPMMPSAPMGGMPMPPPPADATILPPAAGLGESVQPPTAPPLNPPPPGLGEARTGANQALFVVTLPADARLLAEGREIPGSGPVRTFVTPPVELGRDYVYDLAIEVDRGGRTLTDRQTVRFQAGKTANVSFGEPRETMPPPPAGPAPAKSARIRVRVPDGAALYVEGRPWAGPVVLTPPLDPTKTHYYQLRMEVVRDGRRAVVTREVAFRAGEDVTVDFLAPPPAAAHIARNRR